MLDNSKQLIAEVLDLTPKTGIANAAEKFSISKLIVSAVNVLFVLAVVFFFFMLVLGGIRWIISGGDKAATEGAKSQITAAIVGLVIVLSSYAIVNLLGTFFGVDGFINMLDISPINNDLT